eukprot:5515020-Pleurochrysis_carterae.AAC.1
MSTGKTTCASKLTTPLTACRSTRLEGAGVLYVAHGSIEVRKIGTDDNVADVFTKSLPTAVHHKHVKTARGI